MTSKIITLEVQNIKRVKAVAITAAPNVNIISGKNGNGKSSTLDAIEMALGGGRKLPDMPVRAGEETARICLKTEDLTITRHWTSPDVSYLKVEADKFGKIQNPQSLLDTLTGNLSFDPMAFSTMDPKKRVEVLRGITGLDFTQLDKDYKEKFNLRTLKKKEVDTFAITASNFKVNTIEKPEFSVEEIKKMRDDSLEFNKSRDKIINQDIPSLEKDLQTSLKEVKDQEEIIRQMNLKITEAEDKISNEKKLQEKINESVKQLKESVAETKDIDTSDFDEKIDEYRKYEANLDNEKQRQDVIKNRDNAQTEWSTLNNQLEEIVKEKERLLSEAEMPIKGLSFADNDILFKDIPFVQLSTSEQIQVSMAIAMALNTKMKIIIIKNGSLMDAEAFKKVEEIAIEKDFQVWIEKVADGPDANSFYIHDGEIKNE